MRQAAYRASATVDFARMARTPPETLVELLAAARRDGATFDDSWPEALQQAVAGQEDAQGWRDALAATADAWAVCWARRPASRPERALAAVARDDERVELEPDERVEVCAHCDAGLRRSGRGGRVPRFCGRSCRDAASEMARTVGELRRAA